MAGLSPKSLVAGSESHVGVDPGDGSVYRIYAEIQIGEAYNTKLVGPRIEIDRVKGVNRNHGTGKTRTYGSNRPRRRIDLQKTGRRSVCSNTVKQVISRPEVDADKLFARV